MTTRKGGEIKKLVDKIIKELDKPPKLRVIPIIQTKDEKLKAKLLSKILEYQWGTIEERFRNEILKPTLKCYLYGKHNWYGCGKKNKHKCKICGWETYVENNPIYTGEITWSNDL